MQIIHSIKKFNRVIILMINCLINCKNVQPLKREKIKMLDNLIWWYHILH